MMGMSDYSTPLLPARLLQRAGVHNRHREYGFDDRDARNSLVPGFMQKLLTLWRCQLPGYTVRARLSNLPHSEDKGAPCIRAGGRELGSILAESTPTADRNDLKGRILH